MTGRSETRRRGERLGGDEKPGGRSHLQVVFREEVMTRQLKSGPIMSDNAPTARKRGCRSLIIKDLERRPFRALTGAAPLKLSRRRTTIPLAVCPFRALTGAAPDQYRE